MNSPDLIPALPRLLSFVGGLALLLSPPAAAQETYSLDELLEIGREQNPSVLAFRAGAEAAEADRRDAGRWPNPEVGFDVGRGDPFGADESRTVRGFTLRQGLENPWVRHHRLRALDERAGAAAEEVRERVLEVEYEIRLHFYRVLYLRELLRLARLNEEAMAEILELMETRARVGEVKELEAIRLRVEHMRARNEVEAALMELDQFRRHLNTFLGNVLPTDYVLEGELSYDPEEPSLERLTSRVLSDHPALVEAVRMREAARAEWQAARGAWFPSPVISGSSRRVLDGEIRQVGVGIQVPLWNQSRNAARREEEEYRRAAHREEARRMELEAQLMIHHNRLRLARQTLQLFEEGLLAEAETSMEIADTSYRQGEISLVEYLDARRTHQSIQIERQQALFDWNRERAALEQAAGGISP